MDSKLNTTIQGLLSVGGYDAMTDVGQKTIALHNVLIQAIREEVQRLQIEKKDTGLSLQEIGIHFGKFA